MKRVKKWVLVLGLCGPTVTNFSCSTLLGSAVRDAAIKGTSGFIEDTTGTLLDQLLGPDAPTAP
jgi:hypothetical protein